MPRVTGKCLVRCSTLRSSSAIPTSASVANVGEDSLGLAGLRRVVEEARLHVVGMHRGRHELGQLLLAAIEDVRAARVEPAAAGRRQQRRRRAGNLDEPVDVGLEARQRAEQAPRVRVQRMLEELVDRRLLGHARRVHDDDLVGDLGDDAEVVRDHDDRGAVVVLELVHQLEDLRLRRHVEGRRRLVGDEQRRLVDERHRDHHALAHAAGELVRIVVDPPFGPRDPDLLQRLERPRLGLLPRDVLVEQDSLDDLGTDLVHRVQRRHRVLEDHRDVVAAHLAQARRRRLQQILAAEERASLARRRASWD